MFNFQLKDKSYSLSSSSFFSTRESVECSRRDEVSSMTDQSRLCDIISKLFGSAHDSSIAQHIIDNYVPDVRDESSAIIELEEFTLETRLLLIQRR